MEHASLNPLECGFCAHVNPADSRYCNACGAPLRVQPCPQCGTANDATAATCEECEAPLSDSGPSDFFLPLPPETPQPGWTGSPAVTAALAPDPASTEDFVLLDEPAQTPPAAVHRRVEAVVSQPLAARPAEAEDRMAAIEEVSAASSAQSAPEVADVAPTVAAAEEPEPQPAPAPAAATIAPMTDAPARGSGRNLKTLVLLTALGIAVYFGYRHFQRFDPSDAAPSTAASSAAKDILAPAPDKPNTTLPPASASGGTAPAAAREGAGGKGGRSVEPVRTEPTPPKPTDIFIAKPEQPEKAPSPPPDTRKAAAAGTQGEVRRPASGDRGSTATSPAACADALSALGLCKPENTQGRKP